MVNMFYFSVQCMKRYTIPSLLGSRSLKYLWFYERKQNTLNNHKITLTQCRVVDKLECQHTNPHCTNRRSYHPGTRELRRHLA